MRERERKRERERVVSVRERGLCAGRERERKRDKRDTRGGVRACVLIINIFWCEQVSGKWVGRQSCT